MRPEFINIGGIRIRLKDISDYHIDYYRIGPCKVTGIEQVGGFFSSKTKETTYYVNGLINCSKDNSNFGVLFIKTYRKKLFYFSSKECIDCLSSNKWEVPIPFSLSSKESVDVESTLKKLDEYLC